MFESTLFHYFFSLQYIISPLYPYLLQLIIHYLCFYLLLSCYFSYCLTLCIILILIISLVLYHALQALYLSHTACQSTITIITTLHCIHIILIELVFLFQFYSPNLPYQSNWLTILYTATTHTIIILKCHSAPFLPILSLMYFLCSYCIAVLYCLYAISFYLLSPIAAFTLSHYCMVYFD